MARKPRSEPLSQSSACTLKHRFHGIRLGLTSGVRTPCGMNTAWSKLVMRLTDNCVYPHRTQVALNDCIRLRQAPLVVHLHLARLYLCCPLPERPAYVIQACMKHSRDLSRQHPARPASHQGASGSWLHKRRFSTALTAFSCINVHSNHKCFQESTNAFLRCLSAAGPSGRAPAAAAWPSSPVGSPLAVRAARAPPGPGLPPSLAACKISRHAYKCCEAVFSNTVAAAITGNRHAAQVFTSPVLTSFKCIHLSQDAMG